MTEACSSTPVGVIDAFKVIEIEKDHRQFVPVAAGPLHLVIAQRLEMTRIIETGQVIGNGQVADLLMQTGIFDGDGGKISNCGQNSLILLGKLALSDTVKQLDHADNPAAGNHRDTND